MTTQRYAITGLSIRGIYAFLFPILGRASSFGNNDFRQVAGLEAIIEPDAARAEAFCQIVGRDIPVYEPAAFLEALDERRIDRVLVTGPDWTHHGYLTAALGAGRDVVTEKPMVTCSRDAQSVLAAEKASGRRVLMAHNYRYMPIMQELKRLLIEGRIGRVTNMEFIYNLDTFHGSSYFFRWNREGGKSGGLNIHKCCHHFDLANWLIGDEPETLAAFGRLNYYGPRGANRPTSPDGQPLPPAEEKRHCPYFQRHYAGSYSPDSNDIGTGWDEFRISYGFQYPPDEPRYIYDDVIDIEDTYGVVAEYRQGAILNYSCNFSTPWEGFVIGINGTRGRIEVSHRSDPDPTGKTVKPRGDARITVYPLFGGREDVIVAPSEGGHDGADPFMQRDIFLGPSEQSRRLNLAATSYDGALAVCMGEAVRQALKERRTVDVRALLGEHARP